MTRRIGTHLLVDAPTHQQPRRDTKKLIVKRGHTVYSVPAQNQGYAPNLDPSRFPRIRRLEIVDDNCQLGITLHLANLDSFGEVMLPDIERPKDSLIAFGRMGT